MNKSAQTVCLDGKCIWRGTYSPRRLAKHHATQQNRLLRLSRLLLPAWAGSWCYVNTTTGDSCTINMVVQGGEAGAEGNEGASGGEGGRSRGGWARDCVVEGGGEGRCVCAWRNGGGRGEVERETWSSCVHALSLRSSIECRGLVLRLRH